MQALETTKRHRATAGLLLTAAASLLVSCYRNVITLPSHHGDLGARAGRFFSTVDAAFAEHDVLHQIHGLVRKAADALGATKEPKQKVALFNAFFFDALGFQADRDLHSPDNLFPNRVLDRRRGYCTGLALVYASIAQEAGLPVYAVAAPEHLFLRYDDGKTRINIELLERGREISDEMYQRRYHIPNSAIERGVYLRNLDTEGFLSQIANNLGVLRSQEDDFERSGELYRRALELDPRNVAAIYNLAKDQMRQDRCEEAVVGFTRALDLNSSHVSSLNNRGICRAEAGDVKGAEADFQAALAIDPGSAEARRNLRALEQRSRP